MSILPASSFTDSFLFEECFLLFRTSPDTVDSDSDELEPVEFDDDSEDEVDELDELEPEELELFDDPDDVEGILQLSNALELL